MPEAISILRATLGGVFARPFRTLHVAFVPLILFWLSGSLARFDPFAQPDLPDSLFTDNAAYTQALRTSYVISAAEILIFALAMSWLAILWHRHKLEVPGGPGFGPGLFLRYCLRALPISLAFVVVSAPIAVAFSFSEFLFENTRALGAPADFDRAYASWDIYVGFFLGVVLGQYTVFRLSMVLPATATGKKDMGYRGSIALTRDRRGACLALAIMLSAFSTATWWAITAITGNPVGSRLLDWVLSSLEVLIAVALVTELYRRVTPSRP